jgi:hypothetical protein
MTSLAIDSAHCNGKLFRMCMAGKKNLKVRDGSGRSAAGSELPTAVRGGAKFLKGSHRMGDGRIFLKPPRLSL